MDISSIITSMERKHLEESYAKELELRIKADSKIVGLEIEVRELQLALIIDKM